MGGLDGWLAGWLTGDLGLMSSAYAAVIHHHHEACAGWLESRDTSVGSW